MLYYIDESCLEALNENNINCITFLEQLALDRRKGKNLVIASRHVLEQLSMVSQFSSPVRGMYKLLGYSANEYKMLMSKVERYCKVVATPISDRYVMEKGQKVIYISVVEDINKDFTDLSIFLAENSEDISLYKYIGQYYMKKENIQKIKISFDERAGGGSTTSTILKSIIESESRMCLCLVDSDKKYPNSETCGDTMKKVLALRDIKEEIFYEILPLQVHEVENLISLNILKKVQESKNLTIEGIKFLQDILDIDSSDASPVFFFDMKKGILMKNFVLMDDTNDKVKDDFRKQELYRNNWRPFLEYTGKYNEIDKNKNVLVSGICEKVLTYALEEYQNMGEQFEIYEVDEYMKKIWISIGRKVISWGCVGKKNINVSG